MAVAIVVILAVLPFHLTKNPAHYLQLFRCNTPLVPKEKRNEIQNQGMHFLAQDAEQE